jgi:hypothetical protein
MTEITIGSTIIGNSGKKLIVDRIDGDILYSGKLKIKTSAVVRVISPPIVTKFKLGDRVEFIDILNSLTSLAESEAIDKLRDIAAEFSVNSIYEVSLDLHTFAGIFIRRLLVDINPTKFDAIGKDGSEGKYGVLTYPDLSPPTKSDKVGTRVTHIDLYHRYGADTGTIELVDTFGDYRVRWDSDSHVGRYAVDSLKWCEI